MSCNEVFNPQRPDTFFEKVCFFLIAALRAATSVYKPYVNSIDQQVMFAEKSWGSNRFLDVSEKSMTVKVRLSS